MKKWCIALTLLLVAGFCFAQNTLVVVPLQNRGGAGLRGDVETITELMGNAVARTRRFDVVDRAGLEDLMKEHQFQMDDWSSDSKSVEMGRVLNANYIVRGQVSRLGSQMIVTARVLDVNTARILGTSEMQLYNMDEAYSKMEAFVRTLTSDVRPVSSSRQQPAAAPAPVPAASSDYLDFTTGQRWGTWALNWLVPGLGSYVIMKDKVGGTTHLITGGLGLVCFAVGVNLIDGNGGPGAILILGGAGLSLFSGVYNIVRSITYHKPHQTALLFDPEAWNIAILPGKDGIEMVQLSYTLHF